MLYNLINPNLNLNNEIIQFNYINALGVDFVNVEYNEERFVLEGVPEKVDITLIGSKADLYIAKQSQTKHNVKIDLKAEPVFADLNKKLILPTELIANKLGAEVYYTNSRKEMTIKTNEHTIVIPANSAYIKVDGKGQLKPITFDDLETFKFEKFIFDAFWNLFNFI